MRSLLFFQNPWLLLIILLIICLLLIAAAWQARDQQQFRQTQRLVPRDDDIQAVIATAPFQALQAIQQRLAAYQRQLLPGSPDAQWTAAYLHDLGNMIDDVYWVLYETQRSSRTVLMDRLAAAVAQLDIASRTLSVISQSQPDDRAALREALDQVRASIEEG